MDNRDPAFIRNLNLFQNFLCDIGNIDNGKMNLLQDNALICSKNLYIVNSVYYKDSKEHLLWKEAQPLGLETMDKKELDLLLRKTCEEKTPAEDIRKSAGIFHRGGYAGYDTSFGRTSIWHTSLATEYDLRRICIPVYLQEV